MARSFIVAFLVTAVGIAGSATAALKTREASTTVEFNHAGSVAAKCKRGTKPISGGFLDAAFNPGPGSRLFAYSSKKLGRGWDVAGWNYGGGDATLTAFAYCAKGKPLKARSTTVDVPELDESATAVAKCRRSERAVSGGFEDPEFDTGFPITGARVLPHASHRQGRRKWEVSGFNNGVEPGTHTAFVYCAKGIRTKERSSSIEIDPAADTDQVVASCKRRERVLSGGFETELTPSGPGPYVLPYGSRKLGQRKWEVSAYSDGTEAGTVTAYVYCAKKR